MAKVQHTCTGCVPIDASIIDVYVTLVQTNQFVTDAETGRALAEAARVTAENARTATFSEDHSRAVADHTNAQTAINNANAAAAAANAAGITSASASVDSNVGTPSVDVSLVNKQLSLSFHNIKGEKGEKGDRGDGAVPVVNDLVTGGTDAALSAEMGKTLNTTKQATLVSGTNIKTVNGESLLGEGNIVAGDPNAVKYVAQTLTDAQKAQARTNIDAYQKPSTGIPATDLASAAQTSLGKADTAYQKPSGGIPKTDLDSGVQGSLDLADSAIQARPMGEVDPTITPADYATTEELSELEAKVVGKIVIPTKYTNGYIKTSDAPGTVVDLDSPVMLSPWMCYVGECKEGDVAIVSGTGGLSPRLWAFLDTDCKILTQSAASLTAQDLLVTAPTSAAWVVINDNSGEISYLQIDSSITENAEKLRLQNKLNNEFLKELGKKVGGMWETLNKSEWDGGINELYILPNQFISGAKYKVTTSSTLVVLECNMSGALYYAKCTPTQNKVIYDIEVYVSNNISFPVGTIVGKVVFNDYTKLTGTPDASGKSVLSNDYISHFQDYIELEPRIGQLEGKFTGNSANSALVADSANSAGSANTANRATNDGDLFSGVGIAKATRALFDGSLLLSDTDYSFDGRGIAYDSKAISTINNVENYLGRTFSLSLTSIVSSGDKTTSAICLYYYNGATYVGMSDLVHGGETKTFDIPSTGITKIALVAFASVANTSSTVEYNFNGIECKCLAEEDNDVKFPGLYLPSHIYGKVGEPMQLFKRGIIRSYNPYNFAHSFVGTGIVPKDYERYFEITPESAGTKNLQYSIHNNEYEKSQEKNTTLHSVSSVSSPVSQKNVLCLGSSTTTGGEWAGELKRRLTGSGGTPAGLGLSNLVFCGRQNTAHNVKVEGIGGWSFATYMNGVAGIKLSVPSSANAGVNSVYQYTDANGHDVRIYVCEDDAALDGTLSATFYFTSAYKTMPASQSGTMTRIIGTGDETISFTAYESITYSPLLYNGAFTFTHYAQKYCNGSIDIMCNLLTCLNYSETGNDSLDRIMGDVKTFIDTLHSEFPNCKIILSPGVGVNSRGCAANSGSWGVLTLEMRFLEALDAFVNGASYSSFCYIVNSLAEVDMDYGFPTTEKAVNSRVATMEVVGTNMVHPTNAGSLMTADSFYRCFINTCI